MRSQAQTPATRPARGYLPRLFEVTLALFVAGLLLHGLYPWLAPLNRLLGMLLALLAVHSWSQRRGGIPAEVALFGAFVVWAVLTGYLFATDKSLVQLYARQLSQQLVLMFAIAEYATRRRMPNFAFLLLLIAPLFLWWYALSTGQFAVARAGGGDSSRLRSLTDNSNYVGTLCLYGLYGAAYFVWNQKKRGLALWPLSVLPFLGVTLLASGSRKSILAFGIFALTWASFSYGQAKASRRRSVLLLLTVAAVLFMAGRFMIERTPVGERFRQAAVTPKLDPLRYTLYLDGWRMFLGSPIYGIGLGNFILYSSSSEYAHSDSMEALATTGAVGFGLYFSVYLVLWRRLRRILKGRSDATSRYMVGLYQAVVITSLFVGLGRPNFLDAFHLYIVGAIIGHARAMEQELSSVPPAGSGARKDAASPLPVSVRRASWPSI